MLIFPARFERTNGYLGGDNIVSAFQDNPAFAFSRHPFPSCCHLQQLMILGLVPRIHRQLATLGSMLAVFRSLFHAYLLGPQTEAPQGWKSARPSGYARAWKGGRGRFSDAREVQTAKTSVGSLTRNRTDVRGPHCWEVGSEPPPHRQPCCMRSSRTPLNEACRNRPSGVMARY